MKKPLCLILFVLYSSFAISQGFTAKLYTTEDGLLDNVPTGIKQDRSGNLWVRHTRGFTKFDGKTFSQNYDKKIDSYWYWDGKNFITTENGVVYTAGLALKSLPNATENPKLDTFLVYQDRTYERKVREINLINKDGYRVFTMTRPGDKSSNKVYFQFASKLDSIQGPELTSKFISKIKYKGELLRIAETRAIYKDNADNIYLRFCDSIQLTNSFFLFDKGKLKKIITSKNLTGDVRIVSDHNGSCWIIGNTNKTLYAECLDKTGKTIRIIAKPDFFYEDNMWNISEAVADSKNNIWFSWGEVGLVKIGAQDVEIFRDKGRVVPKVSQMYFDVNGREYFTYSKNYSNFYFGFAIDHYDNIICGDRLFDGHQFSSISVEKAFTSLFNTTPGTSVTFINCCLVDRENNIWIGTSNGLIKLSPMPFKKIDTKLSAEEPDYELDQTDPRGRNYYIKKNPQTKTVLLKVTKDGKVIYEKSFKTDNVELDIQPLGEKVIFKYWVDGGKAILEYTDLSGKMEVLKLKSDQSSFQTLIKGDDRILFYYHQPFSLSNTLVYIDPKGIRNFTIPDSIAKKLNDNKNNSLKNIRGNLDLFITSDLSGYELTKDLQLKPVDLRLLFGFKAKPKKFLFYREKASQASYYFDDNGMFLKIKSGKVTKLTVLKWDSISRTSDLKGLYDTDNNFFSNRNLVILKDLFIFASEDNLVLFKMNSRREISLLRKVDFSKTDKYVDFSLQGIYSEGEYLALRGETDLRIVSYKELLENKWNNNIVYRVLPDFGQNISQNEYGERMIGQEVSYLGKRGFNTTPPIISYFEVVFKQGGKVQGMDLKSGDGFSMDYTDSKMFIDYKGICLTDGNKVRYKYKLEGYDSDWTLETKIGTEYSSLPAGTYTFKVYACNNEGVYTKEPNWFKITIIPPWYKRGWAYGLYVVICIGCVYLIVKLNSRRLTAKAKELETKIEEATVEIKEQKKAVEEKNKEIEEKQKEIIDSIRYARRIQTSLLPPEKYIDRVLNQLNKKKPG